MLSCQVQSWVGIEPTTSWWRTVLLTTWLTGPRQTIWFIKKTQVLWTWMWIFFYKIFWFDQTHAPSFRSQTSQVYRMRLCLFKCQQFDQTHAPSFRSQTSQVYRMRLCLFKCQQFDQTHATSRNFQKLVLRMSLSRPRIGIVWIWKRPHPAKLDYHILYCHTSEGLDKRQSEDQMDTFLTKNGIAFDRDRVNTLSFSMCMDYNKIDESKKSGWVAGNLRKRSRRRR